MVSRKTLLNTCYFGRVCVIVIGNGLDLVLEQWLYNNKG